MNYKLDLRFDVNYEFGEYKILILRNYSQLFTIIHLIRFEKVLNVVSLFRSNFRLFPIDLPVQAYPG